MKKIKTALISVSDKKNLKPLLNSLKQNKIKLSVQVVPIKK
jgi:phosphoribosylaminoimidazolecarboxamide formyltransferase/IMP cyclohydrolase